jgi:hypothetical protein
LNTSLDIHSHSNIVLDHYTKVFLEFSETFSMSDCRQKL